MKNKRTYWLLSITLLIAFNLGAQNRTILVFDLVNETLDSITNVSYDTTKQFDATPHYVGDFNSTIELLEQEIPLVNIFPDAEFSLKKKAALDYDLNSFPLRTTVKIFYEENDTLRNLCTGSMVSEKHVLTAAHCLSPVNSNLLDVDTLMVCPTYDNGNPNSNFGCHMVSKVFFLKNWVTGGEDFGVLELDEPIGQTTGWIGIGYDETDHIYEEDIFYKFTYPNIFIPIVDPIPYNGDTIYYNYGKVNLITDRLIGSLNTSGIVGESGSSIIRVKNNESYTSYGVLTFGSNLRHSKITEEIFHLLQHIIKEDITLSHADLAEEANILVFPNPTSGNLRIENIPAFKSVDIKLVDQLGRMVAFKNDFKPTDQLNLSKLANGQYYLIIRMDNSVQIEKIIKSEN